MAPPCPAEHQAMRGAAAAQGFTLVELLVVLAILAATSAIAAPSFARLYAGTRQSFERAEVERQLLELPLSRRQAGRDGVLGGRALTARTDTLALSLPAGWRMQLSEPIRYHFTGACDGGRVRFLLAAGTLDYVLSPPLCRPRLSDAGP